MKIRQTHFWSIAILGLSMQAATLQAQINSSSPRLKAAMEFDIGGGIIGDPPTKVHTVPILDIGVGWDLNMECGEFDPKITVSNQLNGITEGFSNMMDNIIQAATGAVASLPALAIQRANPGLYDMLQQGILQGKMDFEWAETSCEEMQRVLMGAESFPFEKYKLSAKTNIWAQEIDASGGDAVSAKNATDDRNPGNEGVEWVCATKAGGAGQPAMKGLTDVIKVGYNIMFDRNNVCDSSQVTSTDGDGSPMWDYWNGPLTAASWGKTVIGEADLRTCDGCKKIQTVAGKGLTYKIKGLRDDLYEGLMDLVEGTSSMSYQNLIRVSAPPIAEVSRPVILAIRKRNTANRIKMVNKLASEVAYTKVVEQGRLLVQILQTGSKEPNVSNYAPAIGVIKSAIDDITRELDLLQLEQSVRKTVVKHSLQRLLSTEEKNIQAVKTPPRRQTLSITADGQVGE